ncbi:NAD(P)-dependent oxidoreductase [Flavobacterium sp. ASW18X]|uniref:NAD(P)-dependent oxidoreductase n=1 Tax=Flavobacterium sp. ASW18X TaxID=2572595 RepID=UPI0010ADE9F4|nr:NAD(P)-dependent oxidoreductase [Flavobacterium sp. ASW18X]TKD61812.1 alanine dehydrogenase [Flavobacterium sp. ASW18X]
MKFGIIQERKNPPDKRVVLPPELCQTVMETYPAAQLVVEPSSIRVFTDQEYLDAGVPVQDAMESCDVLLGVKEVPINALLPNKKYFFFSHTIKKQPYNRDLLRAILDKNIELYDHEVITNTQGQRLVAFGRYAGIVGAYNGIRAFGLKEQSFNLPKAENLKDQAALITELNKITLPAIKIVLTGMGRVGNGAKEMLDGMGIKEVSVADYLTKEYQEAVYCQIDVLDYNKPKDGSDGDKQAFFNDPSGYESNFFRFAKVSNMFIAGHFYGDGAPYLFTREDAKHPDFKIKVVADISCDIDGPVASTIKPSTIAEPIYGYDAHTEKEVDFLHKDAIAVMAVDNLPAELPRDASGGFGEAFMTHVIPAFFNNDKDGILERARMTKGGQLTQRYQYLADYVLG